MYKVKVVYQGNIIKAILYTKSFVIFWTRKEELTIEERNEYLIWQKIRRWMREFMIDERNVKSNKEINPRLLK